MTGVSFERKFIRACHCFFFACAFTLFFTVSPGYAQEEEDRFFAAALAEAVPYSPAGFAYGGGIKLGYGGRTAIGLRLLYVVDSAGLGVLEPNVFFRFSPFLSGSGPFVEAGIGPVLFARSSAFTLPAGAGTISAGLSFGWRFLLGNHWYVEPALRAGYPFIAGGGLSAGYRF